MEDRIAVQALSTIQQQFGLTPQDGINDLDDASLLAQLQEYLAARILHLMNSSFEQLMSTLYRIDLSETQVKEIFKNTDEQLICNKLAALIIERQVQKAETRAAYRNENKGEIEGIQGV